MEEKRFQVVTFRGFQYCANVPAAIKAAKEMIQGIANDKWDDSFWWARIIDIHVGTSIIVYRKAGCRFCLTSWIALR